MSDVTIVKNRRVQSDFFAFLVGVEGTPAQATYPIEKEKVNIGRGAQNDIALPENARGVHRNHALISYDPLQDKFYIQDKGTQNGTHVNGKPIVKEYLKDNALIILGEEVGLVFKRAW